MRLPSVRSLAIALAPIKTMAKTAITSKADDEESTFIEVRIQIDDDGSWRLHSGSPQYDDDHTGWWGYETIDEDSDLTLCATNMIDEVRDHLYIHGVVTK